MTAETKNSIPGHGFDAFVDFLYNTPNGSSPPKQNGSSVGQGYSDIGELSDEDESSIPSSTCSNHLEDSEKSTLEEPYLMKVTSSYLDSIKKRYSTQYSGLQSEKEGDDSTWSFSAVGRDDTVTSDSRDDDYSISSELCDPSFGKPSELFRDVMQLEDIGRLKAFP